MPNYKESWSLQYNAKETEKYFKTERARKAQKKYSLETPLNIIRDALIEDRMPTSINKTQVIAVVEKAIKLA